MVIEENCHHHWTLPTAATTESLINVKEMAAVYSACLRWSSSWKDSSLVFVTDNTVVQCALNSGRSKNILTLCNFLRRIFWLSIQYNYIFVSAYIPNEIYVICDALSRLLSKDSKMRIRNIDVAGRLCCNYIFQPWLLQEESCGLSKWLFKAMSTPKTLHWHVGHKLMNI